MRRKGFAYIISVLILGLLAFMGFLVMQSSSTEYSAAASSCYVTMAQQLAESASDEAFLLLEREFRRPPPDGKKGPLLEQCGTGDFPFLPNSSSGLSPHLDGLPDFKKYVPQTQWLIDKHLTRAGFKIESIAISLNDCRPIPHLPVGNPSCVYKPRDRMHPFDSPDDAHPNQYKWSRDYYLSIKINTNVSVTLGGRKSNFIFNCTRDMKLINVGPIARQHTLFSCMGPEFKTGDDSEVKYDLSKGNGRLVLWNHPFQSRVYLHGPMVVGIENPDLNNAQDKANNWLGGYVIDEPNGKPGYNQAFQYSQTYGGASYIPYPQRAFWENPKILPGSSNFIEDIRSESDQKMFGHKTYIKGRIMRPNAAWTDFKDFLKLGEQYVRGTAGKQLFLPAGPFCRFPWKHVSYRYQPQWANLKNNPEMWPCDDPELKIEHRYIPGGDANLEKQTTISAAMRKFRIWKLGGLASFDRSPGMTDVFYRDFSLFYGNSRDSESWWDVPGMFVSNVWDSFVTSITLIPGLTFTGIETLWRYIKKPAPAGTPDALSNDVAKNFYPQNFKVFEKAATLKLKDVGEIPTEIAPDGRRVWILDGLYWLDSFETTGPVYYKGKGAIFVGNYVENKPFTIGGSILAMKEGGDKGENHLTLAYHPTLADKSFPNDLNKAYIYIKGKGNIIEASVYSLGGIKTDEGSLTDDDYRILGMDPSKPTAEWTVNFDDLAGRVNVIVGNYVNFFMKKSLLNGDLWVIHDTKNPFYFGQSPTGKQIKEDYSLMDQVMAHSVHLSPKVQHLSFFGATP